MASLHRRKNSQFWYCSFRVPVVDPETGEKAQKQFLRNTKQTDRKKAERAAHGIEEAIRTEYGAGSEKSRKLLGVLSKATELAEQGLLTESVARQHLIEIATIAGGDSLKLWTVREWLREWIKRKERTVKTSTMMLYRVSVKSFLQFLGERAESRLETVTSSDIRKWRDHLKDEGRTSKTVGQYQKSISGAFRAAAKEGILNRNPGEGLEYLPKEDSTKRMPFSLEEIPKLLTAAEGNWKTVILTGFYTGLRLRDITNLKWRDVDLAEKVIRVEPLKQARKKETKKILHVPIHPKLEEALLEIPSSDQPDAFLFPELANKPSGGNGGISGQFKEIMEKAKVDPMIGRTPKKGQKGRAVSARGFHSLRHTFISGLANGNVPSELRRELVGHEDEVTHAIYTHHDQERLRGAVDQLPDLG